MFGAQDLEDNTNGQSNQSQAGYIDDLASTTAPQPTPAPAGQPINGRSPSYPQNNTARATASPFGAPSNITPPVSNSAQQTPSSNDALDIQNQVDQLNSNSAPDNNDSQVMFVPSSEQDDIALQNETNDTIVKTNSSEQKELDSAFYSNTPTDGESIGHNKDMSYQDGDDLLNIKLSALTDLSPLVDHLDQTPEEHFRTTMMLLQATDNKDLIKNAYETAAKISDDKIRAQALLDVVNEINYFTHRDDSEE